MDFTDFRAGTNDSGRKLDRILRHIFKSSTGTNIYSAMRKRLIKVNGAKASADMVLKEGDIISIASFLFENKKNTHDNDEKIMFQTLFRNSHIWIINKPYDINVQPSQSGEKSIAEIIAAQHDYSTSIAFTPAPLHRLDRYTTGVLAVSQSYKGAVWFSQAIASHQIQKKYIGIAEGIINHPETWKDSIENLYTEGNTFHTVKISESGKQAVTHVKPLACGIYKGCPVTLAQYEIETGRKHQIRMQSSFHGHPLLGDSAYRASMLIDTPFRHSFFLHACQILIPKDNSLELPECVTAPLSSDFKAFMKFSLLKWDNETII